MRFSNFTTRELMYLAVIGVATLGIGAALGTGITAVTGVPMAGGLLNAVITAAVLTIGAKGVPRFGTGIILWFVLSVLAVPTLTMGPPGLYKIIIGLAAGALWDVSFLIFGRKTWGYLLAGSVMMLVVMLGVVGASVLLGLPAKEKLLAAFAYIVPVNFILGLFGTYLGAIIFDRRLAHSTYVQKMTMRVEG